MPDYLYRCASGHEWSRIERMLYGTAILCPMCGADAWRKPQPVGVNWGGLRPSQGELSPAVKDLINGVDERKDRHAAMKEYHVNASALES